MWDTFVSYMYKFGKHGRFLCYIEARGGWENMWKSQSPFHSSVACSPTALYNQYVEYIPIAILNLVRWKDTRTSRAHQFTLICSQNFHLTCNDVPFGTPTLAGPVETLLLALLQPRSCCRSSTPHNGHKYHLAREPHAWRARGPPQATRRHSVAHRSFCIR